MKILTVMPYSPVPADFGGALRENYLLQSLASEHEVTLLTFGDAEQKELFIEEFPEPIDNLIMIEEPWERRHRRIAQLYSVLTSRSYYYNNSYSEEMQQKINELLATGAFDAAHCEFSVMGNYDFGDEVLKIMDTHNVEYENFRRMSEKSSSALRRWFYRHEYEKVFEEETKALSEQDVIFSTSDQDRSIMQEDVPDVTNHIIPNGVDTSYFKPNEAVDVQPNSIVFTGMMAYTPNHDGMHYFLDEIYPHILEEKPDTKVYIVGNRPPQDLKERASEQVKVTGFVDDVRPYVWQSSVFVVPLRMGSGTRLKVVESLAMKKPVVSTSLGCEGIAVEDGKSILIEDDPEAFARSILRLFEDRELYDELTENGYEVIKNNYEWESIGDKMLEVYSSLNAAPEDQREMQLAD